LWDLALVVGVGAGTVIGAVSLGVRRDKWPIVLGLYAVALNLGIAEFAYAYWNLSQRAPTSFSESLTKLDAAYLSWTTFTTTGFGDISARTSRARAAVTGEMALTFIGVAGGLAVVLGSRNEPTEE
jgi:hypothetical protein